MRFRGVRFFCKSSLDFRAVLECYADIVLAVNRHVIYHRKPVLFPEGLKWLPLPQFPEVQAYLLPAGGAVGDQVRHLVLAGGCVVVPFGTAFWAVLVLRLVEGEVGGL